MAVNSNYVDVKYEGEDFVITLKSTGEELCKVDGNDPLALANMVGRIEVTERLKEIKQLGY